MNPDPRAIRKGSPAERRTILRKAGAGAGLDHCALDPEMADLADLMVEQSIGYLPVPLGLATGFVIDGESLAIPMATEEPSVVAAAGFAAGRIALHGGFTTWYSGSRVNGTVYLDSFSGPDLLASAPERIHSSHAELVRVLEPHLAAMERRGGGLVGMDASVLADSQTLKVQFTLDVADAMGANLVNTCAEALRRPLEAASGGRVLMAILSNTIPERRAGARFRIPVESLGRAGMAGRVIADRIIRAQKVADLDPDRCVTHNKGIMNGISALALASGNDTRALEAAAHAWAWRGGTCSSLSTYRLLEENGTDWLEGYIELPLALGTVGGAMGIHPVIALTHEILGNPGAGRLAAIAAALGLAQNFSALGALTAEGIQSGHMRLHARRLAWKAGARGPQVDDLAASIVAAGTCNLETAKKLFTDRYKEPDV